MTTLCIVVEILIIFLSLHENNVTGAIWKQFINNKTGAISSVHGVTPVSKLSIEKNSVIDNTLHKNVNNDTNFIRVHSSNSQVEPADIHRTSAINPTVKTTAHHILETNSRPIVTTQNPIPASDATTSNEVPQAVALSGSSVSEAAKHYASTRAPLQCANVLPYLRRSVQAACYSQWPQDSPLPTLSCAVASGYKRIAGTYLERFLYKATYQVMDTSVYDPDLPGDWNGWCGYQTSLMIMKVESPDVISGLPIIEDDHLNGYTEMRDKNSTTLGASFPVMAQGFKDLILDFGPNGLGARVAWMSDYNCSGCASEVWHVEYWRAGEVARLLVNRAWRLRMRFSHAFMSPATFVLGLLREGALVREVAVHGGARWDDHVLFPVRLPRMRRLEFASNSLHELTEFNFIRVPNLLYLNLTNNKFTKLPEGVKYLQRLKYLDLSNNPIVESEFATILCPLGDLKELNLSGAPLGSLDTLMSGNASCKEPSTNASAAYGGLYSRLEVLDVSGCNVSSVETEGARSLWARAGSLRVLRLADNPLASVPPWLAQRLPALQELDLSGCMLATPPALRLAPAQRLRRLLLARNLLATPRGALASGGGAGDGAAYLDVSGNPLRGEWGAGAFAPLGARASVNLSRTHLTALSPHALRSLQPLAQVDLGINPFDCSSCSILPLQEWLRNHTGPEVLWLGTRAPLSCWRPLSLRGQSVRDVRGPAPESCASPPPPAPAAAAPASRGPWWTAGAVAGVASAAVLLAVAVVALLALRFRLHLTYVLHVLRANRALRHASERPFAHCDFDAFVCYSKYDRTWVVGELLPRLEGRAPRYRLCLHERDFPLGALVVQNIVECMERSRRTLIVLTPSFIKSQWCQWELEMATHRLLEGAGRDFLVLVELQRLEARALPRLLRLLVETRTFLQWPSAGGRMDCAGAGAEEMAWKRLRAALGPPMPRASSRRPQTPHPHPNPSTAVPHPPSEKSFRLKEAFAEREVDS